MAFAQVRLADNRAVGSTSFLTMRRRPDDGRLYAVEIGATFLAASAQGTGINREAKLLLLTHAFEVWHVGRVDLKTDARNERARRSIEGIGARFEGILRNWQPSLAHGEPGLLRDSAMFSIVASEWPSISVVLRHAPSPADYPRFACGWLTRCAGNRLPLVRNRRGDVQRGSDTRPSRGPGVASAGRRDAPTSALSRPRPCTPGTVAPGASRWRRTRPRAYGAALCSTWRRGGRPHPVSPHRPTVAHGEAAGGADRSWRPPGGPGPAPGHGGHARVVARCRRRGPGGALRARALVPAAPIVVMATTARRGGGPVSRGGASACISTRCTSPRSTRRWGSSSRPPPSADRTAHGRRPARAARGGPPGSGLRTHVGRSTAHAERPRGMPLAVAAGRRARRVSSRRQGRA